MKHSEKKTAADLHSKNPVARYRACEQMDAEQAKLPGTFERLVELLSDPVDWDCHHYVAVVAADAMARVDPTGRRWMLAACEACRIHLNRGDPDLVRGIVGALRKVTDPATFIEWGRMVLADQPEDRQPWSASFLGLCGSRWYKDRALAEAVVSHSDRGVVLGAAIELLGSRRVINTLIPMFPHERATHEGYLQFVELLESRIPEDVMAEAAQWWRDLEARRYGSRSGDKAG